MRCNNCRLEINARCLVFKRDIRERRKADLGCVDESKRQEWLGREVGFNPWRVKQQLCSVLKGQLAKSEHERRVLERALELIAERWWELCPADHIKPALRCIWPPDPLSNPCRPCKAAFCYALAEAEIEEERNSRLTTKERYKTVDDANELVEKAKLYNTQHEARIRKVEQQNIDLRRELDRLKYRIRKERLEETIRKLRENDVFVLGPNDPCLKTVLVNRARHIVGIYTDITTKEEVVKVWQYDELVHLGIHLMSYSEVPKHDIDSATMQQKASYPKV